VKLERLEVDETEEGFLPHRLEEVVVDVDRLHAVAQVVESVTVNLEQRVVRKVDCFL